MTIVPTLSCPLIPALSLFFIIDVRNAIILCELHQAPVPLSVLIETLACTSVRFL